MFENAGVCSCYSIHTLLFTYLHDYLMIFIYVTEKETSLHVTLCFCRTSIKNGRCQAKNENGRFACGKLQTINNSYRLIILRNYLF